MGQKILEGINTRAQIPALLKEFGAANPLIVCRHIADEHQIDSLLSEASIPFAYYSDYMPNPSYNDVCYGVGMFNRGGYDSIVAVGGGSSIDVAKCIKLFCRMDPAKNYIFQEYNDNSIPLIAIPTTAGTGSESTRFAVIYYNGEKQSIAHESILPDITLLDAELLKTLSVYQKKCTILDALCQGIESWWSVNSTEESRRYSQTAVELIVENITAYIGCWDNDVARNVMLASNYAGRAINITQTTAPHAMSYKLTSMYGIPHGHAVAICLPMVWRYMIENRDKIREPRGTEYLTTIFNDVATTLRCNSTGQAIIWFEGLLEELNITCPSGTNEDAKMLTNSVNPVRLKNNPVNISHDAFLSLYKKIVKVE